MKTLSVEVRKPNTRTIYLVSCVSKKRTSATAAQDLYTSDWFNKARKYVEGTGCPWWILSAKLGLVAPSEVIAPYDETLNKASAQARRDWARSVLVHLRPLLERGDTAVFFAGQKYREHLVGPLEEMGVKVAVPMEGLKIGEQLSWLAKHI